MAATPASGGAYSCETAARTREWMEALAAFLGRLRPLLEAHVVNFKVLPVFPRPATDWRALFVRCVFPSSVVGFAQDRMWELVDAEWMECLRRQPVESLLKLPSGCVQEHWPATLREFVLTARSLVIPREQKALQSLVPDVHVASIGTVLSQGMNSKKKHEIENLAAVVHVIPKSCGAKTVVDVGSGQGYLAQALSFEYQLPVVAIDASSHHASVTVARAERIKKYYAAKRVEKQFLKVPRTVTCHVLSSDTLAAVTLDACKDDHGEHLRETKACTEKSPQIQEPTQSSPPLILAGLHACGDLSVNMLRVFVSCEQVKALVSVGCCYNLLSEDSYEDTNTCPGFPMSKAAKLSELSAERWRSLTMDIALQNFNVHAFRAAFQMVLEKYFPEVSRLSPSIGRQGKALRRQRLRKVVESQMATEKIDDFSCSTLKEQNTNTDGVDSVIYGVDTGPDDIHHDECRKFALFKDFTLSGLGRLGCGSVEDTSLLEIWKDVQPFSVGFVKTPFLIMPSYTLIWY
ncbi:protein RRNAD1 isoform X2 [Panicum miliaceum]|uniref:Protein RRNAD1 isoform X2 n=1 Tax=Panicum miliaceum TaxID=4540 RepID=A0A3L6T0W9_PANMI|nr:protein RRNAD1 isoform X2 [Panicum miliaceum]